MFHLLESNACFQTVEQSNFVQSTFPIKRAFSTVAEHKAFWATSENCPHLRSRMNQFQRKFSFGFDCGLYTKEELQKFVNLWQNWGGEGVSCLTPWSAAKRVGGSLNTPSHFTQSAFRTCSGRVWGKVVRNLVQKLTWWKRTGIAMRVILLSASQLWTSFLWTKDFCNFYFCTVTPFIVCSISTVSLGLNLASCRRRTLGVRAWPNFQQHTPGPVSVWPLLEFWITAPQTDPVSFLVFKGQLPKSNNLTLLHLVIFCAWFVPQISKTNCFGVRKLFPVPMAHKYLQRKPHARTQEHEKTSSQFSHRPWNNFLPICGLLACNFTRCVFHVVSRVFASLTNQGKWQVKYFSNASRKCWLSIKATAEICSSACCRNNSSQTNYRERETLAVLSVAKGECVSIRWKKNCQTSPRSTVDHTWNFRTVTILSGSTIQGQKKIALPPPLQTKLVSISTDIQISEATVMHWFRSGLSFT